MMRHRAHTAVSSSATMQTCACMSMHTHTYTGMCMLNAVCAVSIGVLVGIPSSHLVSSATEG